MDISANYESFSLIIKMQGCYLKFHLQKEKYYVAINNYYFETRIVNLGARNLKSSPSNDHRSHKLNL
jgi:hypothetical protein